MHRPTKINIRIFLIRKYMYIVKISIFKDDYVIYNFITKT